jgi:hypothetical protein
MIRINQGVQVVPPPDTGRGKAKEKQPQIDLVHAPSMIGNLFAPAMSEDVFKIHHFKKHPVVFRAADGDHRMTILRELLFDLDLRDLLQNSASDQIHVWLAQGKDVALESITVDDAEQALKLYKAGHSLYCRAPAELESIVIPRALNELGLGVFGSGNDRFSRGEIETFYSRKGHVTGNTQHTFN